MDEMFYKIARPDGWDWWTGKTINYRECIGKVVRVPARVKSEGPRLCSNGVIHASRKPNDCFFPEVTLPLSIYRVAGTPVAQDKHKCGFRELTILEELDPVTVFDWNYREACNPVHPFSLPAPAIRGAHLMLLRQWASVWNSVWASVWNSVWASVWNSVRASVRDSIEASVWNSVSASVWNSVRDSVSVSVWDSARDSVEAYIGSLFPLPRFAWKYTENIQCGEAYPFQPAVDLWRAGLIPSYDGQWWRLHAGPDGRIVWEGIDSCNRLARLNADAEIEL